MSDHYPFPQPDRLAAAFEQLDVLAVWDIIGTPTIGRAAHVLPPPTPLD